MRKKTVIIGASPNPARYSHWTVQRLLDNGDEPVPVGIRRGTAAGIEILDLKKKPKIEDVDTVTVYMNSRNQQQWEDYLLSLKPKRMIFNPGAENPELQRKASQAGIDAMEACTLVMLRTGQY